MLNENKGAIGSLAASVALIVGSLLPWLSEIDGFEREGFFYGVGIGGWGYGTAILLIGLLMLAGVMKNPFGIPQKIWSGTLGWVLCSCCWVIILTPFGQIKASGYLIPQIQKSDYGLPLAGQVWRSSR